MINKNGSGIEWKEKTLYIGNRLLNLFLYMCLAFLLLMVLQVFCFTLFKIPSDSMEPALLSGDRIVVNKLIKGARLFNVPATLDGKEINIYRMPGFGKLNRNDVLVFNFPYQKGRWDSIRFDVMKYYVKRCIALPGDTLEIRNSFFKIRGVKNGIGNLSAQKRISVLTDSTTYGIVMPAFLWDKKIKWTIQELGPFPVPRRGQLVKLDCMTVSLYQQLINWEQKKKIRIEGALVLIGDSSVSNYRFRENYYFVAGDKAENSRDSRYWGLLPESFIVGKATLIWKSVDPVTGDIRWNRIFKSIK